MLRNCIRCHKLFAHDRSRLCPQCSVENESAYRKLRSHLRANPDSNVGDATRAIGVESRDVMELVQTSRVQIKRPGNWKPHCTGCGREIAQGRYCQHCQETQATSESKPLRKGYQRHRGGYYFSVSELRQRYLFEQPR